ncbi:MAG: aldo/keto reductase [Acidobacteria bacterium]|nr:aldo/keto reductase [Acidobacteriota bacterium]
MELRTLGRTGLQVSKLGLGAASLGGIYGGMTGDEATKLVHAALDSGINLIDTSPFYGVTRSESVLGPALKGVRRDRFIMATKCGRYDDALFDFSAQRVTRSVDESLQRMGLDMIDIFQVHDIEFGSLRQVVEETLPALEKIRAAGKIRFIGVTGLPLKIFQYVIPRHQIDTIISYSRYTLIDQALEGLFPLLEQQGIGLMNASPVALGLLSPHGPQPWHQASKALQEFAKKVVAKWYARGVNLAKVSLQFSMANPRIPCTLTGASTPLELESTLQAAAEPLDTATLTEVLADFAPVRNQSWLQGNPENND